MKYLDGKPFWSVPSARISDARRGHITGGYGKGYKLHALVSESRRIVIWSVVSLNVAEQSVAMEMCLDLEPHVRRLGARGQQL